MSAAVASRNTTAQGQINKANELLREVAGVNGEYANQVWSELKARWATETCTFAFVSEQITAMIECKRAARQLSERTDVPQVNDGRYAIGPAEDTKFYRVTNKDGRYKIFAYASEQQHPVRNWGTMLAILTEIAKVGEQAAALRFGVELQHCFSCGRALTDPVSRAAGQGPDCRRG
jgi:hypothetical protein